MGKRVESFITSLHFCLTMKYQFVQLFLTADLIYVYVIIYTDCWTFGMKCWCCCGITFAVFWHRNLIQIITHFMLKSHNILFEYHSVSTLSINYFKSEKFITNQPGFFAVCSGYSRSGSGIIWKFQTLRCTPEHNFLKIYKNSANR